MHDSLEHVLSRYDDAAPLAQASTIPASWYTDPRIAGARAPHGVEPDLAAGRAAPRRSPSPAAFVTAEVAGEPRRGGARRRRRAARVLQRLPPSRRRRDDRAVWQGDRLRCPYHGWTYDLDGQLRGSPEFDGVADFDRADTGLVAARRRDLGELRVRAPRSRSDAARAFLGRAARARSRRSGFGALRFCERRDYTLACNWKVFVDNYLDGGYHVPHLHQSLSSILTYTDYTIENFERFCLQSSPIEDRGDATPDGRGAQGPGALLLDLPEPDAQLVRGPPRHQPVVIPLGVDRTKVVFDFFFDDVSAGEARSEAHRQSIAVSERIQDEDVAICESVQRGLGSRAYARGGCRCAARPASTCSTGCWRAIYAAGCTALGPSAATVAARASRGVRPVLARSRTSSTILAALPGVRPDLPRAAWSRSTSDE